MREVKETSFCLADPEESTVFVLFLCVATDVIAGAEETEAVLKRKAIEQNLVLSSEIYKRALYIQSNKKLSISSLNVLLLSPICCHIVIVIQGGK